MGKSPRGQYGFSVPTHLANIPNDNGWEDTWEAWCTKAMKAMFEFEALSRSSDDQEFEDLKKDLFSKVIPRLLRPMET